MAAEFTLNDLYDSLKNNPDVYVVEPIEKTYPASVVQILNARDSILESVAIAVAPKVPVAPDDIEALETFGDDLLPELKKYLTKYSRRSRIHGFGINQRLHRRLMFGMLHYLEDLDPKKIKLESTTEVKVKSDQGLRFDRSFRYIQPLKYSSDISLKREISIRPYHSITTALYFDTYHKGREKHFEDFPWTESMNMRDIAQIKLGRDPFRSRLVPLTEDGQKLIEGMHLALREAGINPKAPYKVG